MVYANCKFPTGDTKSILFVAKLKLRLLQQQSVQHLVPGVRGTHKYSDAGSAFIKSKINTMRYAGLKLGPHTSQLSG